MVSYRLIRLTFTLIGLFLTVTNAIMTLRGIVEDDVRVIAYSTFSNQNDRSLHVRPVHLTDERFGWTITDRHETFDGFLSWYNNKVLWENHNQTYFSNWDGSNRQLIHDGDVMVGASPDKEWFSYAHWLEDKENYIYRFVQTSDQTVIDIDLNPHQKLTWFENSHTFLYYTEHDIFMLELSSPISPVQLIHTTDTLQWIRLTPDNQSLLFLTQDATNNASLQHYHFENSIQHELLAFEGTAQIVDFSPDGQWFVLRQTNDPNSGARFYRLSVHDHSPPHLLWEGGDPRKLIITNERIIWSRWDFRPRQTRLFSLSMDSQTITLITLNTGDFDVVQDDLFFSVYGSTTSFLIRSLPDGSHRQVISRNIGNFFIHGQGRWLVVVRDPNNYYRLQLDGSNEDFLVQNNSRGYGYCFTCQLSPDGQHFGYYVGRFDRDPRLITFDLSTGEQTIHRLPSIPENEDLDANTLIDSFIWTSHQGFDQVTLDLDGRYLSHMFRIDVQSGIIYGTPWDRQGGLGGYMDEILPFTTLNIADQPHYLPFFIGLFLIIFSSIIGAKLNLYIN